MGGGSTAWVGKGDRLAINRGLDGLARMCADFILYVSLWRELYTKNPRTSAQSAVHFRPFVARYP
jgi:hypothetical protein